MVFGTPHYMAPEQAAGQAVDNRTDIYALGVIMYEMFTGKVPFDADTFMGILSKHMFEPPVPPSQHTTGVKLGAIEDIIMKALAKKQEERYQTMDELIRDLETVSSGGVVAIGGTHGITPPSNLADALEPPSRTEMRLSVGGASGGKSKLPLVLGALAVLVVLGGGIAGAVYAFGSAHAGTDTPDPIATVPPPLPTLPDAHVPDAPETEVAPNVRGPVQIRTDPPGAQVLVAGAIIGNSPVSVPRPATGETRDVEIRMRGRETATVQITDATTDVLDVSLEELEPDHREHTDERHEGDHGTRMTTTTTTTMQTVSEPVMDTVMETVMETVMQPVMHGPSNDVVDPWAN